MPWGVCVRSSVPQCGLVDSPVCEAAFEGVGGRGSGAGVRDLAHLSL